MKSPCVQRAATKGWMSQYKPVEIWHKPERDTYSIMLPLDKLMLIFIWEKQARLDRTPGTKYCNEEETSSPDARAAKPQ